MAKVRTTIKEIKNAYPRLIKIGYCDAQFLLRFQDPIAYTAGVNGWGCDLYYINGYTAITTGYSPVGNIEPGYEVVHKYDEEAREAIYNTSGYENQKKAVDAILERFVAEVMANR